MLSLVVAVAVTAAPPPAPDLAFDVWAPEGADWALRAGETVQVARRTLGLRTRLRLRTPKELERLEHALSPCRRRPSLPCWVRNMLRQDSLRDPEMPYFVLVRLLPLPRPERALVLIWMIDVAQARRRIDPSNPSSIQRWVVRYGTSRRFEVTWGDGALEQAFARLWDEKSADFGRRGYWWPNGTVEVRSPWLPPLQVTVDDEPVVTSTAATVILRQVGAGLRRIRIRSPEAYVDRTVTVTRGQRTVIHIDPEVDVVHASDARTAVKWTGLGIAGLGAAITVAGLVTPVQTELLAVCREDQPCPSPGRFTRVSDYFSSRTSDDGSGPLVIPLGYSLMISGGIWFLSASFIDDPDLRWWAVLLGGLLGGTAYGITEAVQ